MNLSKLQRSILDVLIEMFNQRGSFDHVEFLNRLKVFDLRLIIDACQSLKSNGFIDRLIVADCGTILDIRLTYAGHAYREFLHFERVRFWRNSVLVPVAVSVLTTIVLKLIEQLPQLLQQID